MEESRQAFIVFAKGIGDFSARLLVTDFPILVVDNEEQASGIIRALKDTGYSDLAFSFQPFMAAAQIAAHEVLIDKALDGERGEIASDLCQTANEIFRRSGARPAGEGNAGAWSDDGDTPPKTPRDKEPSKAAWQAYYVREALGITNQTKIAEEMTEQGTLATQGQVSRWLAAVDAWLKAGGIKPTLEELHEQPKSIDPAKLDMGARQDGRTPSQRDTMTDPADDWD